MLGCREITHVSEITCINSLYVCSYYAWISTWNLYRLTLWLYVTYCIISRLLSSRKTKSGKSAMCSVNILVTYWICFKFWVWWMKHVSFDDLWSFSTLNVLALCSCLLAVCTTEGHVRLYRMPFLEFSAEWVEVWIKQGCGIVYS